jgi:signal peptidase I
VKRRLMLTLFFAAFLAGCGTHYYRVDGSSMTLILRKPEAKSVILACSLDGFNPRPALNIDGRWEVTLPAEEGFTYFYRVDGVPYVPDCPMKEKDDFGSENCIFDPQL